MEIPVRRIIRTRSDMENQYAGSGNNGSGRQRIASVQYGRSVKLEDIAADIHGRRTDVTDFNKIIIGGVAEGGIRTGHSIGHSGTAKGCDFGKENRVSGETGGIQLGAAVQTDRGRSCRSRNIDWKSDRHGSGSVR